MNKTILSSAIFSVLLISGCGGSSDDNNETIPGKTITVIDGYIEKAEICVDRDGDGICGSGESLGFTSSNGKFTIPHSDANYPVIVRSIAGLSIDSDRIGYLTNSYEMTAQQEDSVVTPFTTLANARGITVEELADELNLNANVISGDYVVAKDDEATRGYALEAHALARSLVHELPANSADLNGDKLFESATAINNAINDHLNDSDIETLEDIDFVRSDNGDYESIEVINDLNSYLIGNNDSADNPETVWNVANFGTYWAKEEGVFSAWLTKDELCVDGNDLNRTYSCGEYSIKEQTLIIEGDNGSENNEFIYTSSNLSFVVPDEGDLTLWTTEDILSAELDFVIADFEHKTWHIVLDDSNSEISKPTYATFQFNDFNEETNTGEVILVEDGQENYATTWTINDGNLTIVFDELPSDNDIELSYSATNGTIMIVANLEHDEDVFSFMTQDGDLAQNIVKKWKEAK
ncbi:hypothetical protein BCU70_20715 [Vibrio sp. 10N.286.49.C2]|uniref:hypothetical protein n=1 Tax=unclassified Vibrio TaxID=2614977 RepID=UPI000C84CF49|nr:MULTISPECIES: hypothetical protein [unclassified Vibrio]PMH33165.1 hypothetical protein BCU70_20715 [Vibrio sp. 10N.286.49.C2]PMH51221.1 hypothetical protein BCU66_17505 [Vibrio sp. 10N.286.49.B1]PMH81983.1 hypothetical protein BCU58_19795 [Vibrio sp. 10N.286.48.B7]